MIAAPQIIKTPNPYLEFIGFDTSGNAEYVYTQWGDNYHICYLSKEDINHDIVKKALDFKLLSNMYDYFKAKQTDRVIIKTTCDNLEDRLVVKYNYRPISITEKTRSIISELESTLVLKEIVSENQRIISNILGVDMTFNFTVEEPIAGIIKDVDPNDLKKNGGMLLTIFKHYAGNEGIVLYDATPVEGPEVSFQAQNFSPFNSNFIYFESLSETYRKLLLFNISATITSYMNFLKKQALEFYNLELRDFNLCQTLWNFYPDNANGPVIDVCFIDAAEHRFIKSI